MRLGPPPDRNTRLSRWREMEAGLLIAEIQLYPLTLWVWPR